MFNSIITSILRATKTIKIPGGKISLSLTAKSTKRSPPPPRRIVR